MSMYIYMSMFILLGESNSLALNMGDVEAAKVGNVIPEVLLNSGHKMPLIGLGTGGSGHPPTDALAAIFLQAVEVGYRHFDTASLYGSEEALGRAVAEALRLGLVKSRDEFFITTKLGCTEAHPDLVVPALKDSLRRLALDYVDLYLIHWPVRLKPETKGFDIPKENILPFDIKGTWEAMEECSRLGLAKSIGVSNFGPKKISEILQSCAIPPAVNQVEMNVAWQQEELRQYCREKGIHVSAWSPLAANGAYWGSLAVMESPVLKDIAEARRTTVPQIALRWVYQQGVSPMVKSFNKERMKENLGILEWELTEEELDKIKQIPQARGLPGTFFVHENGPYKSIEELWA